MIFFFIIIPYKIWLTASHIAGKDNITADIQFRKFNDQVEWQLNKEIFKHIYSSPLPILKGMHQFVVPPVDYFCSKLYTDYECF
jgi:hypothetical protein